MYKKLNPWFHVSDCLTDNLSIYLGRTVDGQRSNCLIESYVRQKIGTLLFHGAFLFDTILVIPESNKENLTVVSAYLVIDSKNEAVNVIY